MKKLLAAVTVLAVSAAQADTIHVDDDNCPGPGDGSVGNPYCAIQTAIDNAVDTDEIVVAPGSYFETINFLGKAVWLRSSDGPVATTIDAGRFEGVSVVTCNTGEGRDTVLQGFTIRGGSGTLTPFPSYPGQPRPCPDQPAGGGMFIEVGSPAVIDCVFTDNTVVGQCDVVPLTGRGGGMYSLNASPTLTDCTFVGNFAEDRGGGLQIAGGNPLVIDCTFDQNTAGRRGGGIGTIGGFPMVTGCTFSANHSDFGGGIHNEGNTPSIIDCTFVGNTVDLTGGAIDNLNSSPLVSHCIFVANDAMAGGGAIRNLRDSSPLIVACMFLNNVGLTGGGIFNVSIDAPPARPIIVDCEFRGNTADNGYGGGVDNYTGSDVTIHQCVFADNTSTNNGGGIHTSLLAGVTVIASTFRGNSAPLPGGGISNRGVATATNCIFWDNSPDQVFDDVGSVTTVRYTDVQGGFPGTGNIDADPLFVDPDNGDFRLLSGSPCIDAAHNWAIAGITDTDLDGNSRFAADKNDFDPGCGIPVVVDMGAYEFQGDPFPVKLGDIDGDGTVGITDFLALLADWGSCSQTCCLADLDLDENVGITDFLILLGNWG